MFLTIVLYQMENMESSVQDYAGISFMELYRLCRADFLVASDLALRAQVGRCNIMSHSHFLTVFHTLKLSFQLSHSVKNCQTLSSNVTQCPSQPHRHNTFLCLS